MLKHTSKKAALLISSAIISASGQALWAQDDRCRVTDGPLPEGCELPNATTVVTTPAAPNTEMDSGALSNDAGFVLSIDGEPIDADPRVEDQVRKVDLALARADIQVRFDGLGVKPRLDMSLDSGFTPPVAGDVIGVQSRLNYPAFVERAEVRVLRMDGRLGDRVVSVHPIAPNGAASIRVPEGENIAIVHRVYDARGRYDETKPVYLREAGAEAVDNGVELGSDRTARRRIPVHGGAITVSSDNVAPGSTVSTLGESLRPAPDGAFVIQRILPAGEYEIDVKVNGGAPQDFTRDVSIPASEWFYHAVADVTFGRRFGDTTRDKDYQTGRLGFYVKGKTQGGYNITASADTGEEDLDELFSKLDEKDPRSVLGRIDPDDGYTEFGDDSTIEDDTPTSGKFYLKVEREGNFVLWGDYKSRIAGNALVRNERNLYGAQAVWASPEQTSRGEPRTSVELYAAQPDTLPARDVFRGTGGSVYFLQKQDINIGSETITVELRDVDSGRVIERRLLQRGTDYEINYIQGTVVLDRPLSGSQGGGLITTNPGGDTQINLVAQYEFTPLAGTLDDFSYGGRVETSATDRLRFGVTGMSEATGGEDQNIVGVDVLYHIGKEGFLRFDYARTDGPGFANSYSTDGGLIVDTQAAAGGAGEAYNLEFAATFEDLGLQGEGAIGAYFQERKQGFSTLDYQVTALTGDETLWGVYLRGERDERFRWELYYDDYENEAGRYKRELGAEGTYVVNEQLELTFAAEHLQRQTGERTDVAVKAAFTQSDDFSWYVFGQVTADTDGLRKNNRAGIGGRYRFSDQLSAEAEISGGSYGAGGRILLNYDRDENTSVYVGYEVDPTESFTRLGSVGNHEGSFIAGGRRQINDRLSYFGENEYDVFSDRSTLTSSYGIIYDATEHLSFDLATEIGQVQDSTNGDFDRTALSFGVSYEDSAWSTRAKLEYRRERGETSGTSRDGDFYFLDVNSRYKISEEQRLLFNFEAAYSDTDQSSILDGELVDASIGYAFRPIDNDRLNVLFSYRFLYDTIGQRIDGTDELGPIQRSHVLSADAIYDLNQNWTVGGKLGLRMADSAPDEGVALESNDAVLGVVNLQYHLVHKWDAQIEARYLKAEQAGFEEFGVVTSLYRHIGNNVKVGVGYNFGSFSDDLTDLTYDDRGVFINLIAKF